MRKQASPLDANWPEKPKQAHALGIEKRAIDRRQAWQNYVETHFNIVRRMADHGFAQATTWDEFRAVHERFCGDYNTQAHFAHRDRADGPPLDV